MKEQENIVCLKIRRHVKSNIRLKFLTRRVISYWNHRTDVVSGESLTTFTIKLDKFMTAKGEI